MQTILLTDRQKQELRKYGISCEGSMNLILERIQDRILEVGYDESYMQMNKDGYALEHLFDELFPLGEAEYV